MLSILIPTYNYNVLPLVQKLQKLANCENIAFEIIVLDDASTDSISIAENQKINQLEHCMYELLKKNIGRSRMRNLLAKKAKYEWLLFLDADTLPIHDNFISVYLPHLDQEEKVVYGGIKYQEEKPSDDKLLRWVYGNSREALLAEQRQKAPHLSLLTLNFAISKSIFSKVTFNESIPNLRHEDTLFSYDLSVEKVTVEHIENPVYHLGLESSEIFMKKSEESVVGLKYLTDNNLLPQSYTRIAKIHNSIRKSGLAPLARLSFKIVKRSFNKNLLGSNPSLFIFDLYRLGYLCSLK
ncbi:glycosyltransferase family 2 protein [Flavobacterium cerinum]|uniref:Glycosyltransferase family 2 protein n=1 Tax=Flavobacterium cerinum TaxID=2502784 RepID=A0A3S3TSY3_9FLAO|nr:glycosyltransferase family 2 protein [Flavobacterium cerinum]RWW92092.1 glycosyltransferase family 2 protein [Flavobacterium cerinum]